MTPPAQVLVVDDDEDIQWTLTALLKGWGYEATAARSGDEALKLVEMEPVGLVLTDVTMPGMSGVELAKRLKDRHPRLPVVLMTGRTSQMEAAIESGTIFLLKP